MILSVFFPNELRSITLFKSLWNRNNVQNQFFDFDLDD